MKIPARVHLCVFAAAMTISLAAHSYPGESIVLDPATGDYTVNYWSGASLGQIVFVPATKITPAVQSKFELSSAEKINYRYTVSSGLQSKQRLNSILIDPARQLIVGRDVPANFDSLTSQEESAALKAPNGWEGWIAPSLSGDGARVSWHPTYDMHPTSDMESNGIKPGDTLHGFGLSSYALPGLGIIQLRGAHPVLSFPDEGFGSDSAIADQFYRLPDFVPRTAAVPTIAVPSPFDPAVTLERIQAHMHTWIAKQLLDTSFSTQLDRSFQSAISAYRLNQPKVGKKQIQTMRELIHKEYQDLGSDEEHESEKSQGKDYDKKSALIDRLAARILDFDLEFVTKRMGGDKED